MDVFDQAGEIEAMHREAAIAAARQALKYPAPEMISGVACCVECGEPIPAARLRALPGCGLCVECAE